jgi:hypothetical protein
VRYAVAICASCIACGDGVTYAYTTGDGIKVELLDGVDVPQEDVEAATRIFKLVLPEYGRKVKPGWLAFGLDIQELCNRDNVAGCASVMVCSGCMNVLWIGGFEKNAYFHEQLHVTGYRLTGIVDNAHAVFPWAKIAEMHRLYAEGAKE